MKRLVILLLLGSLLMAAKPVSAAASISVDQPPPYHWGGTITLTVEIPKLKGYEFPIVLMRCENAAGEFMWGYFHRWDTGSGNPGPEPVILGDPVNSEQPPWTMADGNADCTVELWAYGGLSHPHSEHLLAAAPDIHVDF